MADIELIITLKNVTAHTDHLPNFQGDHYILF